MRGDSVALGGFDSRAPPPTSVDLVADEDARAEHHRPPLLAPAAIVEADAACHQAEVAADAEPAALCAHINLGVVVEVERGIRRQLPVRELGQPGIPLEVEAGAAPVGEQIVELEIRRAVLVDVEGDDEVGDGLGVCLGLPKPRLNDIGMAAALMNLGYAVLRSGAGESEHHESHGEVEIRAHPPQGAEILGSSGLPDEVLRAITEHHERWDGSGFPAALSGDAIGLPARIIGLADAYVLLRSHRPHRRALGPRAATDFIMSGCGVLFDPEVVGEATRMLQATASAKLTLAEDRAPGPLPTAGDRRATLQIVMNLLSNAIKFTPPGGRVTVRTGRAGAAVVVSVEDTGMGISRADIERIGRPFELGPLERDGVARIGQLGQGGAELPAQAVALGILGGRAGRSWIVLRLG